MGQGMARCRNLLVYGIFSHIDLIIGVTYGLVFRILQAE